MTRLRLGTRRSRLASMQARWVADRLRDASPGLIVEIVEVETLGDRVRDVPLGPHLGQSFFTKEIELLLLAGRVDLAVHSCKDLATVMADGLRLAAVPVREDPRDALVSRSGPLATLPPGARVGTSSPRRKGFLALARPDLEILDLRGNVPTRVRAVDEGRLDAVVLALAGLRRLGLQGRVTEILDPGVVLPAAAQGALAIQIRDDNAAVAELVEVLENQEARTEVTAERACLRALHAGCQAPVGALAHSRGPAIQLDAAVVTPDGVVRATASGPASDAVSIGASAAASLLQSLGMTSLREAAWAGPEPARSSRANGNDG